MTTPPTAADQEAMRLHLVPVRFRDAAAYVAMWHRHHAAPVGHIFSIGAADTDGVLRGVVIVGRPVARRLDDGTTLEVTPDRHRRHPQRQLAAVRRGVASCAGTGIPPADHVHAGRRVRRVPARCGVARHRPAPGAPGVGPAVPAAHSAGN